MIKFNEMYDWKINKICRHCYASPLRLYSKTYMATTWRHQLRRKSKVDQSQATEVHSIAEVLYNQNPPLQTFSPKEPRIRSSFQRDHSIRWMTHVTTCNRIKLNFVSSINYIHHSKGGSSSATHSSALYGKQAMGQPR